MAEKVKCTSCKKDRPIKEFWKSNNLEMYPENGRVDLCRSCLTKDVKDFNDLRGVRELCKVMDYPYIEKKWKDVVDKIESSDRCDLSTPTKKKETIRKALGDYARQMKLVAYKDKSYIDSDPIITLVGDSAAAAEELKEKVKEEDLESIEIGSSLSTEERAFLMQKWDTTDLNDIMYLEEYYLSMMEDYEITTRSHKDYLIMIAIISLKLKKALKDDDWDAIKTLRITYSSFMKEADFTAQQANKDKSDFASSFGEVAAFLESRGFIDTIDLEFPRDTVDKTIGNLNSYTRDLVLNENGLGDLLESTIKLMNAPEEDEDSDYEYGDDDIWNDDLEIDYSGEEEEFEILDDKKAKSDKDE